MSDRTTAFILGGVTVLAWVIVWEGLIRAWATTHPDSTTADAALKLVG